MWRNKIRTVLTVSLKPTSLSTRKPCSRVNCMCTHVSLGKGSYGTSNANGNVTAEMKGEKLEIPRDVKPKTNRPFIKEIFVGEFDESMLVFPEALSEQRLNELTEKLKPLQAFMSTEVDATAIDRDAVVPSSILERIRELGLYGLQVPVEYGGLGFNATEMARAMEILSGESSIALSLAMHNAVCIKSIVLCGNDSQKAKYLPKLASGEYIAGFALTEPESGCNLAEIKTLATQSEDGNTYFLTGEKLLVTNGNIADVFITFAKIETLDTLGDPVGHVTAFIVQKDAGGVVCGPPQDKIGVRGAQTCSVRFENTPVPKENIIAAMGMGFAVAVTSTHNTRYLAGAWAAGMGKRLLDAAIEHTINHSRFSKKLKDYGLIQKKLVDTAVALYAMESMTYMTAATLDSYEEPDVTVEAAIVKVYTASLIKQCVENCVDIFGGQAFMKQFPYERYVRDSRLFSWLFEGTNEVMHIFIALSGFQHAGLNKQELILKMRDPLNNLSTVWNATFMKMMDSRKNPRLSLRLHVLVHPNLSFCAEELEKRIMKFKYEVERYLAVFGDKIIDEQMLLKRISQIVIDIYAVTCVLARASRSKCIGLRNDDDEVQLAEMFCSEAVRRLDDRIAELETGKFCNGDELRENIAENIIANHGYPAVSPLTRNW